MKKFLFMALIAGSLFSCSKQDNVNTKEDTGESSVSITVTQSALSKGITDQKGDPEYAIIGSGKLYFLDVNYNSIYQRQLTDAEVALIQNTSGTATSGNTVTISGVPSSAQYLYFMANIMTAAGQPFPIVDGTTSADARLRIDKIQGDAKNVPMSGLSPQFTNTGTNKFSATVSLTPIVARIEIGQVTCQNQNHPGVAVSSDITKFKLAGIFINNVNQDVLLNGTPYLNAPINITNQGGWGTSWATYFNNNNNFPYFVGGSPSGPTDWIPNALVNYCTPANAALTFYPDATNGAIETNPNLTPKKAWAYQVTPSSAHVGTTPSGDIPHIILKLTDVEYNNNPLGQATQYVTVTKYKDMSDAPIYEFQKGHVYRIQNLTFTHDEATNQPYDENISVTATVSVVPWTVKDIVPEW